MTSKNSQIIHSDVDFTGDGDEFSRNENHLIQVILRYYNNDKIIGCF